MNTSLLKPHVSSWGYAFFITVNATSIWGGIFPFLPLEFQTTEVTLIFYLSQALAFWGAFVASMIGSYFFPHGARRMLISLSAILVFLGSAFLIGAMYHTGYSLYLVALGGIFLGIGCAGLYMLWQRYFASLPTEKGNLRLIIGTGVAPFVYFALYLVPIALTAFLVPFVFVPLCALCVALSIRTMKIDQPMFEDVPRQHPMVYRQVIKVYWRSALCVGSLAFASGIIRGIAVLHPEISTVVNISSMLGSLVSAVVLLILWSRFSFKLNLTTSFRVIYPLVITVFLLLPLLGSAYLNVLSAITYMMFTFVLMLMMMQCAQISRDRGINPIFIYAFFGSIVYAMQSIGFLMGWFSDSIPELLPYRSFIIVIISSYVLGMTLFLASGTLFKGLTDKMTRSVEAIEFPPLQAEKPKDKEAAKKMQRKRPSPSEDFGIIRDRISKQCFILQDQYGLSSRETEVMELIARGTSVKKIAEKLVISENTVRTHSKHIYTKLDIHKRQELLEMLE